jgi:hypothetical protein
MLHLLAVNASILLLCILWFASLHSKGFAGSAAYLMLNVIFSSSFCGDESTTSCIDDCTLMKEASSCKNIPKASTQLVVSVAV